MQALTTLLGNRRPRGFLRRIDWWVGQLCSFECIFVLFLDSNELKTIINFPFPIDETVVFGALCIPMMAFVAWREGLYSAGCRSSSRRRCSSPGPSPRVHGRCRRRSSTRASPIF